VHALREPELLPRQERQADALPLPRVQEVLLVENEHGDGSEQPAASQMGLRDLLGDYESQGREQHETAPRPGEYVRGMAHTNGVESFWAMLRRAYHGTYHKISPKHLQRYINEFAGRHNLRPLDTIDQIHHVVAGMVGRRLTYRNLTADNGLAARAV